MVYALVHSNFEFIFRVPAIGFLLAAIGGVALSIGDSARKEEAQPSKGAGRGWRMEGRGWRRRAGLLAAAAGAVVFLILPSARGYLSGRAAAGGFLLLEKGLVDPAAACFSRAHDLDRSAHPPLYGLARAEMARFHRAAARTEAYARIEKLLEQAGAGNPWDVRTEWTRAAFLSRLGDLAGAESALRRAQGLDPSNPFFSLELARLRLSLRDPRGAAALLRQASETYPPIWPAALSLLVSRVENGAILRELAPRGATFRRDLVYALLAARRTAEGREEAERAARNDPDDGDSWLALGRAAAADGRTGEARDAYRRSLALDPDNGTVWAELGGLHLRRGEDEEGLRCFLTAVGFSPTALGPARSAGALLLSRRGAEAALGYWDSLSRRAPEWGYPHFARAEIRLGMNDRKGASSDLAKALEREPENPRFLALLRRLQP